MGITKLDAAKHQLITAIRLFFEDRDPIAVTSLAGNASEIVDTLCKNKGHLRTVDEILRRFPNVNEKYIRSLKHHDRNFFKHADRNSEMSLDNYDEDFNDFLIMTAVQDLFALTKTVPIEIQVFQIWCIAAHPEKLNPDTSEETFSKIEEMFPDFSDLSRRQKKLKGLSILLHAKKSPSVIGDTSTDRTKVDDWPETILLGVKAVKELPPI
jgi:hypothetical protein